MLTLLPRCCRSTCDCRYLAELQGSRCPIRKACAATKKQKEPRVGLKRLCAGALSNSRLREPRHATSLWGRELLPQRLERARDGSLERAVTSSLKALRKKFSAPERSSVSRLAQS